MIELLALAGSRWAALVWPLVWQGSIVGLAARACLIGQCFVAERIAVIVSSTGR